MQQSSAEFTCKRIEKLRKVPTDSATQKRDRFPTVFFDRSNRCRQRVVPGCLHKADTAALILLQQWPRNAVGIVEHLQPGLAERTQAALVDRMRFVALDLLRAAFARAHRDAATGRAKIAGTVVPGRNARAVFLRRHRIRDQVFNRVLDRLCEHPAGTHADATGADKFQEVSAIKSRHQSSYL